MHIQENIFASAQASDPAALQLLLAQLRPNIRRSASYQCRRSSSIDDVVQEALIIVYRRVGTVRSIAALSGRLIKIVSRLCLLPALLFVKGVDEIWNIENSARFAKMPTDELRIDLIRALESLSAAHREIVLLRDLQEMTIGEIAHYLGISREAAKCRLLRARTMVKEYLLPESAA